MVKTEQQSEKSATVHVRPNGDEIDLLDYIRVLVRHRWMIVLICMTTAVAAAVISFLLPVYYAAAASIVPPIEMLQRESDLAGGLGAGKGSLLSEAIGVTSIADLYAGILRSRAVIDAIIDKFDLMSVYDTEYRVEARGKLKKRSRIEVSEEGIVSITVEDTDPNRAKAMAQTYVDELDQLNKRLSAGQATSKRVFLENRLTELEKELSQIDNLLSREAKTKEMLYDLLAREYELAKIEEAKSMPTIQILDEPAVPEKKCRPKRARMVLLSTAIALFVSVFAAFGREYVTRAKALSASRSA